MNNLVTRDAKRIIHGYANILKHVDAQVLPQVARGLATEFCIPKKVMLKAMARYTRIHHTI